MRCEDHYMLGCFLLEQSSVPIRPACRRMFLMGCVEPDINLLTFIRGTNKKRFLRGHCAQSSEKHLKKLLNKFTDAGVSTPMQWFLLGTAMHYLADSFVYVHNDYVRVRHSEHRNYEIRLHETLRVCLAKWKPGTGKSLPFAVYPHRLPIRHSSGGPGVYATEKRRPSSDAGNSAAGLMPQKRRGAGIKRKSGKTESAAPLSSEIRPRFPFPHIFVFCFIFK